MPLQVCQGAKMTCSFGASPSFLQVPPKNKVFTTTVPDANIMDHVPTTNIMPFGMCSSPTNPQVASATTAAAGVLTPQPCIPVTTSPWTPGAPKVLIGNQLALDNTCTLLCEWKGIITFSDAGETTVNIP